MSNGRPSEPPTISYGAGGRLEKEKAGPAEVATKTANRVQEGVTWVVLAVVLGIWALVGAIFWIPLLIRALMRFSLSHLESMFENQRPAEAGRILRNAVAFYRRGFVVAVEGVTKEEVDPGPNAPMLENRLLLEVLWAILVWYFVLLGFGWIQASPLDLFNAFLNLPWGETFETLIQPFRG